MIAISLFTLVGFVTVLGFIGNYIFKKTGVPDILILLVLGLLLGPVTQIVPSETLTGFSQIFSSLALMIILFEGGLNLDLYKVLQESSMAIVLALLSVISSMIITSFFTMFFLGWDLLPGLLLGVMVGGSSSSIVVPLVRKIKTSEKIVTLLSLESAFTDALTVVIGITLLQVLAVPTSNGVYSVSHGIASELSIGATLGLIIGILWLRILKSVEDEPYKNILTLGVVFLAYSFVEAVGGNGAISSLMFGLVLGNARTISYILRSRESMKTEKAMKEFHSEISFLVRSFFFVYLGMIVVFESYFLFLLGVLLSSLLLIGRTLSVHLATIKKPHLMKNRKLMSAMLPRGLAAAVLSQLPVVYGLKNAYVYPDVVLTVIMSTVILCTFGVFIISRVNNGKRKKDGKSKK
jgi:cell volume regulation protein A